METFAEEMIAAQFWCSAGYTGKPIYLCSESLTAKKTYGTSQFPFNSTFASRAYEYKEGLCPKAEEVLTRLVTMPWDESWELTRVEKAAQAFKATFEKLSSKNVSVTAVVRSQEKVNSSVSSSTTLLKKSRIGIIGCGQWMGQWHLDAYRKMESVELTAFVDTGYNQGKYFLLKR